jgi:nicotinamide phosphoribosyltransferase
MTINKTLILNSDSYKLSQFKQDPLGLTNRFSYIESRGGLWDQTVFFGPQIYLKEYLSRPFTQDDIDFTELLVKPHGLPFNREGWEYILKEHGGHPPLRIKAAPEGLVIPTKNVLVTVENTDRKCGWLTNYVEPPLLRSVWYPTTVATNSYESKRIILDYLIKTGDPSLIDFKLVDFGLRGVSSFESAGIGGLAHLVNFQATDNLTALLYGREYYNIDVAGYSIPASEHSIACSYMAIALKNAIILSNDSKNELAYIRQMLKFLDEYSMVAIVGDAYNIYNFAELMGSIKDEIIEKTEGGKLIVLRPDSGDPPEVVTRCLQILDKHFGSEINGKGFKILNRVRIIQGDGITQDTIDRILYRAMNAGYSADNITFGQGGKLLQGVDRDTQKFAMKCSSIEVDDVQYDVFKSPITDKGKESKKGRITLYKNDDGFFTDLEGRTDCTEVLETVYENGRILKEYTFDEVRRNAAI